VSRVNKEWPPLVKPVYKLKKEYNKLLREQVEEFSEAARNQLRRRLEQDDLQGNPRAA
jgi:hypothetical protein